MNNQKELLKTTGQFTAHDKQGTPVILEWQKTTLFSPEFATAMKNVWEIARDAYMPVEMQFLRTHPEVVGTEDHYKPFESLFKNGLDAVDWVKAEEVMETLLKSLFIFDPSTFGPEITAQFAKDICYVITIRDQQTNIVRGFRTFIVRSNYAQGEVKGMSIAIDPKHQNRGLGKLLTSSILRIIPSVKRIFLCTRVTNENAQHAFYAWGFTKDTHPIMDHAFNPKHWIFLEHKTATTNVLQQTAARLIMAKVSSKLA